jgi:hypothetical protein
MSSSNIPLYAQGTYDRELNYKLWSTYKSRFNAAARFRKKHDLSTKAVAMLSAYVVIFSLITTMLPQFSQGGTSQAILFISSALSIIILVVSQLESSQNYSVRAHTNHQSGLAISELYNELRILKTRYGDNKGPEFFEVVETIAKRYDDILKRSENHEDIDFACFRASKPKYEDHALTKLDVFRIHLFLFAGQYLFYYLCMLVPPLLFGIFVFYTHRLQ